MKVTGKCAILFGAAGGMGKVCANKLLQLGAKIAVVDIAEEAGHKTATQFDKTFAGRVIFVKCDVTKQSDVEEAFKTVTGQLGSIQICMNFAGVVLEKDWEKTMDINFGGCVRITTSAKKWMSRVDGDDELNLIHVASAGGLYRLAIIPIYMASKHAMVGYLRSVSADRKLNGLDGFRVNVLCPFFVDTPFITADNNNSLLSDKDWKILIEKSWKDGKIISPDMVAEGMLQLIEDDSLNGECLVIQAERGCFLDEATTDKFYSQLL